MNEVAETFNGRGSDIRYCDNDNDEEEGGRDNAGEREGEGIGKWGE